MPHIRIRSLNEAAVRNLSRELPQELASVMQTSVDNFSIELVATTFFKDGKRVEGDPMIEVLWFERGQEIRDKSANIITELVRKQTPAEYISVVFSALAQESYYENGSHF